MNFDDSAMNYFESSDHKIGDDLDFCKRYFKGIKFNKLLDVATAAGHFSKVFKANLKVAADISINMLKVAKEKNALKNVVLCNAEEMPFNNNVFDIVTCRIALHHFHYPSNFFKETYRVLKKNGFFVLIDNIVDIDEYYLNKIELIRDKTHIKSLTVQEILSLADKKFRLLSFKNIFKKHNFYEWATRLNPTQDNLNDIEQAFFDLPEYLKQELRVEIDGKKIISYTDKKGVFIFQKI